MPDLSTNADGEKMVEQQATDRVITYDFDAHYTQPSNVTTSSSGGGSVTFGMSGAEVTAGATTGDAADLIGRSWWGVDNMNKLTLTLWYHVHDATPWTDDGLLGAAKFDGDRTQSTGWDLTNENYVVAGTTAAAHSINANSRGVLRIEIDWQEGTTRFLNRNAGGWTDDVTLNDTIEPRPRIVNVLSNGAGETVSIHHFSLAASGVVPE